MLTSAINSFSSVFMFPLKITKTDQDDNGCDLNLSDTGADQDANQFQEQVRKTSLVPDRRLSRAM